MEVAEKGEGAPQIRTWLITQIGDYVPPDKRLLFDRSLPRSIRTLFEQKAAERETWSPLGYFAATLETADRVTGSGDLGSCWDIGRFTAGHEAGAVRTFALKVLRPSILMSLATSLWQVHYRNAGRVVTHVAGARSINFSLIDYPIPNRAHCLAVGGWVQGALELGPRRGVHVEKKTCRCNGAPTCDYRVSWEER